MNRAAVANAYALDEQAVEMTIAGPRNPRYVRTKCADENILWVYRWDVRYDDGKAPVVG